MAWDSSPVNISWRGTANGTTSGSLDTTGKDFLVCVLATAASAGTIADSKTNTWTSLTHQGGGPDCQMFYVKNATCGTGHTFTNSGSGNYAACFVYAFSGSDLTAPFQAENGAVAGSSATSVQTGSVTPNAAADLVVTGLSLGTNSTPSATIDNAFTTVLALNYDGTTSYTGAITYKLQTGAVNPTWSWTGGVTGASAVIATFKAATGGGGVTVAQESGIFSQQLSGAMVGLVYR